MDSWKIRLNTWLASRTQRERWLVYIVAFVVVIALGDQLFTSPLQKQIVAANSQIEAEQQNIAELQAEVATLAAQLRQDPDRVLRARIERLQADNTQLDEALNEFTVDLIQPAEMTRVLREMLADEKGLRLVRLANSQGEPITLATKSTDNGEGTAKQSNEEPHLYRHKLEMEVEGGYLDVLRYLKRLEALEWAFYWEGLEFSVEKYPNARVVIRLSTLGLREGWIGV